MPAKKTRALNAQWLTRDDIKPGQYSDGNGLTLKVDDKGGKRWFQRVTIDSKQHNVGLGGYPAVGLLAARKASETNLKEVRVGRNPLIKKQAERRAAVAIARMPTFGQLAEELLEKWSPSWTESYAEAWIGSIRKYAVPVLGNTRIDQIEAADVLGSAGNSVGTEAGNWKNSPPAVSGHFRVRTD